MPRDFAEYGEAIGAASTVLRNNAASAGLAAPVPTCPQWTVADLVVHQGMVHRWAADLISGRGGRGAAAHESAGRASADLLGWFDEGATALLQTLVDAPEDLDVPFFLPDAPPPRLAWARRQAHETTIHAVDAMAARLGAPPAPEQVWFGPELAADGIDELLTGFAVRPKTGLHSTPPRSLHVAPTDVDQAWTVLIAAEATTTSRGAPGGSVDCTLTGAAREAYLGLWNRGPMTAQGSSEVTNLWRTSVQVRWG